MAATIPFHSERATEDGICVVKVGGAVVENPETMAALLDSFTKLKGMKMLVHGGGRSATRMAERLGIETTMVDGRRVTDASMLDVVTMVYGGLVNKQIVAALQARGINALGLTGADLNLIKAHRRPLTPEGVDFGWVGDVEAADGERLLSLMTQGITPVLAPLTHDGCGHMLNTNADTMAATAAAALAKAVRTASQHGSISQHSAEQTPVTLTYCFELPGVMRDADDATSLIKEIDKPLFGQLVKDGVVKGGMIPKLENAFNSIHNGVSRVVITRFDHIDGGTSVV